MDETKEQKIKQFNDKKTPEVKTSIDDKKTKINDTTVPEDNTNAGVIKKKASETAEQKKIEEEEEKKAKEEEETREKIEHDILNRSARQIDNAKEAISFSASPFLQWLNKQPTPGGLATIIGIIIFFMLAIVPVNSNGDTRLKLLWLTLQGRTHVDYEHIIPGSVAPSSTIVDATPTTSLPTITTPSINPPITISSLDNIDFLSIFNMGN